VAAEYQRPHPLTNRPSLYTDPVQKLWKLAHIWQSYQQLCNVLFYGRPRCTEWKWIGLNTELLAVTMFYLTHKNGNFIERERYERITAQLQLAALPFPPEQWGLSGRQERILSELFCAVLCTGTLHIKGKCTVVWTVLGGSLGSMQMPVQSIACEDSSSPWLISNYVPSGTLSTHWLNPAIVHYVAWCHGR